LLGIVFIHGGNFLERRIVVDSLVIFAGKWIVHASPPQVYFLAAQLSR